MSKGSPPQTEKPSSPAGVTRVDAGSRRTKEQLRIIGRRIEDRRAAVGAGIDWFCDQVGFLRAQYWHKVLARKGEFFRDAEVRKSAELLFAPPGWPEAFTPDPERVEALVRARTSLITKRASAALEVGDAVALKLPACTHAPRSGGVLAWCAHCVREIVAESERLLAARFEKQYGPAMQDALATKRAAILECLRAIEALAAGAEGAGMRHQHDNQAAMQAKVKAYGQCRSAVERIARSLTAAGVQPETQD